MTAARVAATASIGAMLAWGVKALVIWSAGGLGKSSLEGPLFLLGFALVVIACGAFGLAVTAGRPAWVRAVGLVVMVVGGTVVLFAIEDLVGGLVPESAGWVSEEAGLWVASALIAAIVLGGLAWRERRPV